MFFFVTFIIFIFFTLLQNRCQRMCLLSCQQRCSHINHGKKIFYLTFVRYSSSLLFLFSFFSLFFLFFFFFFFFLTFDIFTFLFFLIPFLFLLVSFLILFGFLFISFWISFGFGLYNIIKLNKTANDTCHEK